MALLADVFIFLVALLHFGFMLLESFLWQTPFAKKRFAMSDQKASDTAVLAKNQGLYNLFLTGAIIFAQCYRGEPVYSAIITYVLGCVIVAGIVGGLTVTKRIFVIQAVPAIIGLVFLRLSL